MDNIDYSTIEHDFLHVKDYFSNYKFTYKERRSKLDFLLNISNEPIHDTSSLIASSKEQLVEVKNVYKRIDEEIKDLSGRIYTAEQRLAKSTEELNHISAQEASLQAEYSHLLSLHEKVLENDKLCEELAEIERKISETEARIEQKKIEIDPSIVNEKIEEEKALREQRDDLAAKQRRLTIINTENYIEDIFYWEKQYLEILEKILGTVTVTINEDRCNLKVTKNEAVLEMNIKGKRLVDCLISKNSSEQKLSEFERIKEYAMKINDSRLILIYFSMNY